MLPDGGVRQSNPEVLAYYILNQDPQLEGRRIIGNITLNLLITGITCISPVRPTISSVMKPSCQQLPGSFQAHPDLKKNMVICNFSLPLYRPVYGWRRERFCFREAVDRLSALDFRQSDVVCSTSRGGNFMTVNLRALEVVVSYTYRRRHTYGCPEIILSGCSL